MEERKKISLNNAHLPDVIKYLYNEVLGMVGVRFLFNQHLKQPDGTTKNVQWYKTIPWVQLPQDDCIEICLECGIEPDPGSIVDPPITLSGIRFKGWQVQTNTVNFLAQYDVSFESDVDYFFKILDKGYNQGFKNLESNLQDIEEPPHDMLEGKNSQPNPKTIDRHKKIWFLDQKYIREESRDTDWSDAIVHPKREDIIEYLKKKGITCSKRTLSNVRGEGIREQWDYDVFRKEIKVDTEKENYNNDEFKEDDKEFLSKHNY